MPGIHACTAGRDRLPARAGDGGQPGDPRRDSAAASGSGRSSRRPGPGFTESPAAWRDILPDRKARGAADPPLAQATAAPASGRPLIMFDPASRTGIACHYIYGIIRLKHSRHGCGKRFGNGPCRNRRVIPPEARRSDRKSGWCRFRPCCKLLRSYASGRALPAATGRSAAAEAAHGGTALATDQAAGTYRGFRPQSRSIWPVSPFGMLKRVFFRDPVT
jgi:hypothetical protein